MTDEPTSPVEPPRVRDEPILAPQRRDPWDEPGAAYRMRWWRQVVEFPPVVWMVLTATAFSVCTALMGVFGFLMLVPASLAFGKAIMADAEEHGLMMVIHISAAFMVGVVVYTIARLV